MRLETLSMRLDYTARSSHLHDVDQYTPLFSAQHQGVVIVGSSDDDEITGCSSIEQTAAKACTFCVLSLSPFLFLFLFLLLFLLLFLF